jgi:hypothetical protein
MHLPNQQLPVLSFSVVHEGQCPKNLVIVLLDGESQRTPVRFTLVLQTL